jgi:hypothetical protein
MKKILFLATLLISVGNIFAFTTQANWRWRNDDGTETTATWKANQNTAIALTSTSEVFRLRLEVYNNTGSSVNIEDSLQYATSTAGPWTNLDTLPGSNPFIISQTSAFVVQDEPTTSQLTGVALTFVAGKIMVDSTVLKNYSIADQRRTEFEWAIKGTANTAPNTTYYFRHWGSTSNPLDIGMTYPSLTTAAVLPITLADFSLKKEDKKVKLEWSTVSEQNSDKFEVEKSNDGISWKTIAQVKAIGTSNEVNHYSSYDETPSSGINYYRLKQYDLDGHSKLSVIKSLKFTGVNTIAVSPNPARGNINFKLENISAANVSVSLTNANGRLIHREFVKTVDAGKLYKLNLTQQPTPGMYILNLQAEGLKESIKVVIQ